MEDAEDELRSLRSTKAQEIELKRLELEKTEFEIQTAEGAIRALSLEAPRDGVVIVGSIPWEGRKVLVGDSVWPGFVAMSLPDLSAMRIVARLVDVDDGHVEPGMTARVTLDSYPDESMSAVVEDVTPVAQEISSRSLRRVFRVRLALEDADPSRMRPGMSAKVEIVRERKDDVLMVPRAAVDFSSTPHHVSLDDGNTTPVTLGSCNAFVCVVEDGLSESASLARRSGT